MSMALINASISTALNFLLFAGVPFAIYYTYHRRRHGRTFVEICQRAGLATGDVKYLGYSLAAAGATVAMLIIWPPPLEEMTRKGAAQHAFVGLGVSLESVILALLYGVVKTGFPEEFLFRGLIAGSLARRLPFTWANLLQALFFLAPHLLLLLIVPELWWFLPLIFAAALFTGWLRIKSGSILGPWLIHAAANVTTCLSVAARTG